MRYVYQVLALLAFIPSFLFAADILLYIILALFIPALLILAIVFGLYFLCR